VDLAIEKLKKPSADTTAPAVLSELSGELDELTRALDRRQDLLKGLE
jgi:hypothetical protein